MMSKPKYIVILTGLFVAYWQAVLCTFTRFSINILARVDFFWYDNMPLAWQAKPRPKTMTMCSFFIVSFNLFNISLHFICKIETIQRLYM